MAEEPIFTRREVAEILGVVPLTISNREKNGKYPEPKRDINGYRQYMLTDILNLQMITSSHVDTRPIMAVLYDKGYNNPQKAGKLIEKALNELQRK